LARPPFSLFSVILPPGGGPILVNGVLRAKETVMRFRIDDFGLEIWLIPQLGGEAPPEGSTLVQPGAAHLWAGSWFPRGESSRLVLLGIVRHLERHLTGLERAETSWLQERVIAALRDGRISAHIRERTFGGPALSRATQEPQGDEPPPASKSWISVTLWDTDGTPSQGHTCSLAPPGGAAVRSVLGTDGGASLDGIPDGWCTVGFPDIDTRPKGPVPPESDAEPMLQARRITRADAERTWQLASGAAYDFQIQRREAVVMELEHFHDGGAVLLPGRAPGETGADAPSGVAAIRSCLRRAAAYSMERIRILGHGARSQARADGVAAMLQRRRDDWSAAAARDAGDDDLRSILAWVAETFSWDCDPGDEGDTGEALRRFKQRYDQGHAPRISVDTAADAPAFGAFFD
jgi:hypothetical protein